MTASGPKAARATRPKARRKRRSRWGLATGIGIPLVVAFAVVVLVVFTQITLTFEGRVWTLPARIYAAPLRIGRGMALDRTALTSRLARSGYSEVSGVPSRPGEFRKRPAGLDLYVRASPGGGKSAPARRLAIDWSGDTIASLRDPAGRAAGAADLEPELLALVFGPKQEEREIVPLTEVPKSLIAAVLAAEDARFYHHAGVDPIAVVRASFENLRQGRIVQGASTITQQTVKNLYLGQERTWWRKAREALMSVILDLRYSKDRILEVYLNEVYLGQRGAVAICGVEAASRHYFGRPISDLTVAECATLAGLIRNPGGYNPFQHPEKAIGRRADVLDAMVDAGSLDKAAAAKAKAEPLHLANGGGGFAQARYVVDLVRAQLAEQYAPEALAADGLKIYTTIDTQAQASAESSLAAGLARLERDIPQVKRQVAQRRLQGAVVVTDPRTGAILALVGGRDYGGSQFDRATSAKRQPGSCFKPFVYLTALEAGQKGEPGGVTPATLLDDSPLEMRSGGKIWQPENYDGLFRGPVSVRAALEQSLNVPTVRVADGVGLRRVVQVAQRCGLREPFDPLPSLALGAQEVTPLELASAYGTLAALGLRAEPRIIERVETKDGTIVERREPEIRQAIRPEVAFVVDDLLRGVLLRGTAASAPALGFQGDAAGKTGTTDDTRDAWFVGFTPETLALVWVGYDDNSKTGLTGARGALPIWVDLMMRIRYRWEGATFAEPPGVVHVDVDPETGQMDEGGCPSHVEEIFLAGTEPPPCETHRSGFGSWWRRLFHKKRDPNEPI